MGIYLYTLLNKKRQATLNGQKIELFNFDFRMKLWFHWSEKNLHEVLKDNADERFLRLNPDYVVLGGFQDGMDVFKNVKRGFWVDCDKFPGEHVGKLKVVGSRSLLIVPKA